jgi:hypothetical protein
MKTARSLGNKLDQGTPGKVDHDLMMLQSLAALDRSQVPDDAVMAVAHSRQMAVVEVPHVVSMHWAAIPLILDRLESNRWLEADLRAHFPSQPGR